MNIINNLITQENINLLCTAVIGPLIMVLAKYLICFVELKTKKLIEDTKNEKLKKYLGIAEDAIKTAVLAVTQTYVDNIKKQGKIFFDKEQQDEAFKRAKEQAMAIMGEKALAVLKEELSNGEIDLWIETKIEQYVKTTK